MARQGSQPELVVFDATDIGSPKLNEALDFYAERSGSYEASSKANMERALAVYSSDNGYVLWHFGLFENNACCAFGTGLYSVNDNILIVDYIYTTSTINWPIYYGYVVDRIRATFARFYENPEYILSEMPERRQLFSTSGNRYEQARTLATLGFQLLDIHYEQPFFQPRTEATQGPVDDKHTTGSLAVKTRNQKETSISPNKVDDFIEFIYMVYYVKWPEFSWDEATRDIYTHEMQRLKKQIQKRYSDRSLIKFLSLPGSKASKGLDRPRAIFTLLIYTAMAGITIFLGISVHEVSFNRIVGYLLFEFVVIFVIIYFEIVPKNFSELMRELRGLIGLR